MSERISLEPEAAAVCDANAVPPFLFQLPPWRGRELVEEAQSTPVCMCPADIRKTVMNTGRWGRIPVYIVVPQPHRWKNFSDRIWDNKEKLVRELAARTGSVVVFPEYTRSPEARYPVAIEQCYSVLSRLPELAAVMNISYDPSALVIAGDSVGGNMAIAMIFMAKQRKGPCMQSLLLYYPVTNACFDTKSYCQFAENYYLYREGMMWFWNQYTRSEQERNQITASPLRALTEQLCGFPPTMILNGEADVLRDEGEAFARKLREAGVSVTAIRFQGMIHDIVMLNALDQTNACRAAMDVSVDWICRTGCGAV